MNSHKFERRLIFQLLDALKDARHELYSDRHSHYTAEELAREFKKIDKAIDDAESYL